MRKNIDPTPTNTHSKSQEKAIVFFKKSERLFQNVALEDWKVRTLVAGWIHIKHNLTYDDSKPPSDPIDRWEWLWSNYKCDLYRLAMITGLRENVFFPFEKAKGYRLIYPDGSISRVAEIKILLPFMSKADKIEYGLTKKKSKSKTKV